MRPTIRFSAFALVLFGAATAAAQPAPPRPPSPSPPSGAPGNPTAPNTPPAPTTPPLQTAPTSGNGPRPTGAAPIPTFGPSQPIPATPNQVQTATAAQMQAERPVPPPEYVEPGPAPRQVSFDEAITAATSRNVETRTAETEITAADATHFGTRGENLPKLRVEGAVQEWDKSFDLPFALPGVPGPAPVLTVRDQFTWTFAATIIQPITGLFTTLYRTKADRLGVDVAKLQRDATKRDVGFRTAEQYLRLLEAKRLVAVAHASVVTLDAQKKQAESLYHNGVIAKNDLLRAELAVSNAQQREIQSRGNVTLGRGRLAQLMGLKPGDDIDAAQLAATADPATTQAVSVQNAESAASSRRLEVSVFKKKTEQAEARVDAAHGLLLPQVNGVANYTHFAGSAFQQQDAAYLGISGSWDIWDWGTLYSRTKEANAHKDEADLAVERIEEQVRLEARQAAVDAQTAREALGVAKTALEQAEENYRIVSLRYQQAQSTTFDVVDAESLLTQARAQVENATYGWLVAQLGLQRATGEGVPRVK